MIVDFNTAFPATETVVTASADSTDLLLSVEHVHRLCTRKRTEVPGGREVAVQVGLAKVLVGAEHFDGVYALPATDCSTRNEEKEHVASAKKNEYGICIHLRFITKRSWKERGMTTLTIS